MSESWNTARRVTIAEPAWDGGVALLTRDITWTATVDQIGDELSATSDGANYIEIDWVAIGRPSPGASSAAIIAEHQARLEGDVVLASDLLALEARVDDAETAIAASVGAISALDTRVETTGDGITATASRLAVVEARVVDPASGLGALVSAIDAVESLVASNEAGVQVVQATAIRVLCSAIRQAAVEGIEAGAREAETGRAMRDMVAGATQTLDTRITLTDGQIAILAQEITLLEAAIPDLASTIALAALTATVTVQGNDVAAAVSDIVLLGADLDGLGADLADKVEATALAAPDCQVPSAVGAITAQGSLVTSLSAGLTTTNTNVSAAQTAANDAATQAGGKGKVIVQSAAPAAGDRLAQNLWIDTTCSANTPKRWNRSAWVAVTDKIATDAIAAAAAAMAAASTKIEASALSALDGRVTVTETGIVSQAAEITVVKAGLGQPNLIANGSFASGDLTGREWRRWTGSCGRAAVRVLRQLSTL